MKKITRLLCSALVLWGLCTSPLLAQELAKQNLQATCTQAVKQMEGGNFEGAWQLLLPLYPQFEQDSNLNFLLGQCMMALKRPSEAVAYYSRILAQNPSLPRVRLELGRAYAASGQMSAAKKEFNAVLATSPPPIVAENVRKFIAMLDAQKKINIKVSAGYVYDSNVNAGPEDIVIHGPWTMNMHKQVDHGITMSVGLDAVRPYSATGSWQDSLSYGRLDYFHHADLSCQDVSLSTGPTIRTGAQTISLPLSMKTTWVGNRQYRFAVGLAPQLQYQLSSQRQVVISGGLFTQRYPSVSDRDGTVWNLNIAERFYVSPNQQDNFFEIGAGCGAEMAKVDTFAAHSVSARAMYYCRLDHGWWGLVQDSYTIYRYRGTEMYAVWVLNSNASRMDHQNTWQAMVGKTVGDWNYMAGYSVVHNLSNLDIYAYRRALVHLQASKLF